MPQRFLFNSKCSRVCLQIRCLANFLEGQKNIHETYEPKSYSIQKQVDRAVKNTKLSRRLLGLRVLGENCSAFSKLPADSWRIMRSASGPTESCQT